MALPCDTSATGSARLAGQQKGLLAEAAAGKGRGSSLTALDRQKAATVQKRAFLTCQGTSQRQLPTLRCSPILERGRGRTLAWRAAQVRQSLL